MIAILGIGTSFAQEKDDFISCGTRKMTDEEKQTLPWYGNNQYLYDFLDSLEGGGSNFRTEGVSFEGYKVAVQDWVYRRDDGSGTVPQDFHIMNLINAANEILELNNVKIQFYLVCNVIPINKTVFHSEIETDRQHENMLLENNNPNALNVHFVRSNRADPRWGGKANFPSDNPPYSFAQTTASFVFLRPNPTTPDEYLDAATTFLHEFGHCMNLLHTHTGKWQCDNNSECGNCKQEYVDRDRRLGGLCWAGGIGNLAAEVNGDLLVDTDADPKLLSNNTRWVDTNCNYRPSFTDGTGFHQIAHTTDNDGNTWTPPTRNIMSYSLRSCRRTSNSITRSQKVIMYSRLEQYRNPFPIRPKIIYNDNEVDEYENDNHFMAADEVDISRFPRRHHTFHFDSGSWGTPEACDEDWIKFELVTTRKVIAVTRPAPISSNQVDADTRLQLYREIINPDGTTGITLVASDDNSSLYGIGFSRIEEDNLLPGTYYVRVFNELKVPGHYVIGIFPERENWGSYPSGTGGGGTGGGNPDGEIDFGVDDPFTGGDIDGDGTLDYVCNGAQLNLQGLDNDPLWSVQWSTNNSSVSAVNGLIQAGNFSGEVIITALIYYNGALVGNAMKTIWVGVPQAPTLNITGLRDNNVKCEGEPIYLSAANSTQGFATSYKWTAYKNLVQVYETTTTGSYLGVNAFIRNLPVGNYLAQVSACNECGCNESQFVSLTVIPNTDPACGSINPRRGKIQINSIIENEIIIYPNPVSNQLIIKLPSIYTENPTQVELYNSIGQLVLSKNYKETNIEFSVLSYPKGLYILKIQNGEELKTEKIIIE